MNSTTVAVVGDLMNSSTSTLAAVPTLPQPGESTISDGGCDSSPPAVANPPRQYFPQAAVEAVPRYLPMVGPLTPRPNLTLADAVRRAA